MGYEPKLLNLTNLLALVKPKYNYTTHTSKLSVLLGPYDGTGRFYE